MCNTIGKLCGIKECKSCFNRSFAISKHVKNWDYDLNEKKPHV